MDKEELMKMAHDAGFDVGLGMPLDDKVRPVFKIAQDEMQAFASAILERAALECEDQSSEKHGIYCYEYARAIRALKPSNDA